MEQIKTWKEELEQAKKELGEAKLELEIEEVDRKGGEQDTEKNRGSPRKLHKTAQTQHTSPRRT